MDESLKNTVLFEASWEVCNKVGGIYTVITSKAAHALATFGDDYFMVGPFEEQHPHGFEQHSPPAHLRSAIDRLLQKGIQCTYGRWNIPGKPQVILVDVRNYTYATNDIKRMLWEKYSIDSLGTDFFDFDKPVVWSWAVGMLIDEFSAESDKKIIGHFHEWLAGAGSLYLNMYNPSIATVFTTHATVLGRALAERHSNIYEILTTLSPEEKAKELNLNAKFHLERASAQKSHTFTTVSEITAQEAEHFLKRKPDILTYNGLDINALPTPDKINATRTITREKLNKLCTALFFPHAPFDISSALFVGLFGRYEYHVKGIDITINALKSINERLKMENSERTIVCFFFIPMGGKGIRQELLDSLETVDECRTTFEIISSDMFLRLINAQCTGKPISSHVIFSDSYGAQLEDAVQKLKGPNPPLKTTHYIDNEHNNLLLNSLKEQGLDNSKDQRVKAIFCPIYLESDDGLLNAEYEEVVAACDIGLYPSYYEPWGYTPLEAVSLCVPSITTNVAGFGRFVATLSDNEALGINKNALHIIDRKNTSSEEASRMLAETLKKFITFSPEEIQNARLTARKIAEHADWKEFFTRYKEAYLYACEHSK
ncbi:MAG: glycogen/starch synthase [Candidatus Woesearchaeota archaeon]